MKTREDHVEFMRLNGPRIAVCAWNGHKANGRGLVCVLADLHNDIFQQVPFDFMPEVDASKIFKRWYGTKESRMVAGYDPEKEVVICFVRKGDDDKTDIDAYKIKTRPAPPVAPERED